MLAEKVRGLLVAFCWCCCCCCCCWCCASFVVGSVEAPNGVLGVAETRDLEFFLSKHKIKDSDVFKTLTTSSICKCKWLCRVHPECKAATFKLTSSPEQIECKLGKPSNTILPFLWSPEEMTFVTDFGNENPQMNVFHEIRVGGNANNQLYFSFDDPQHIYWVLREPLKRDAAIEGCAKYPNSHLAFLTNENQLRIARDILNNEKEGVPLHNATGKKKMVLHLNMNMIGKDKLTMNASGTTIQVSSYPDGYAYISGNGPPVFFQLTSNNFFLNDLPDDLAFSLCRTSIAK